MNWRDKIRAELQKRSEDDLLRQRQTLDSPQGARVTVDGKELLNFCSNDYLGLANHPRLIEAVQEGASRWGAGSGASHLVCGHLRPHEEAERRLAVFVGAEAALLFSTGYMANLALPAALLGRDDLILEDRLNHASLIDAALLSRAALGRYPHLNIRSLDERAEAHENGQVLISTDAVFSMDGNLAPVTFIDELARRVDGIAVFDDAHGFGVLGNGRGTLAQMEVRPSGSTLMVGTLGKALGLSGAFVAGDQEIINYLLQFARPYIYTTALPPSIAHAISTALDLVENEPERHAQLQQNIHQFRSAAEAANLNLMKSTTAIQPLVVGSAGKATALSEALAQGGFLVGAIRPPTVPIGTARLRITLSAAQGKEDIDHLVSVLAENIEKQDKEG